MLNPPLFFDNMHDRPILVVQRHGRDMPLRRSCLTKQHGSTMVLFWWDAGAMWADNFRLLVWSNDRWREV